MGTISNILISFPSGGELIIVVLVILLLFGSDKIPEFARMFGKGMREFRKATEDIKRELNTETKEIRDEIQKEKTNLTDRIREFREELNNKADSPIKKNTETEPVDDDETDAYK